MPRIGLIHEELSRSVIGAFFDVYNTLGFGFLEHVYVASLTRELRNRGHKVGREVSVPVFYKGEEVARQRLDMIVDHQLVVEVKSTETLHLGVARQVENYLRATNLEVGLLLHFGPRPQFFRAVCSNSDMRGPKKPPPRNPPFQRDPRNPSVGVARGNESGSEQRT
jgi:GxxExxY protein